MQNLGQTITGVNGGNPFANLGESMTGFNGGNPFANLYDVDVDVNRDYNGDWTADVVVGDNNWGADATGVVTK